LQSQQRAPALALLIAYPGGQGNGLIDIREPATKIFM